MTTAHDLVLPTSRGMWSVEAKHERAGGDVDVVLAFRPDRGSRKLYGFRRDQGEWTQLAGTWMTVPAAVRAVAQATRLQVLAVRHVIPLLDTAAALADFPDASEAAVARARSELAARVDAEAAREKYALEKADDLQEGSA